jgi:hypothetical protein
MSDELLLVRPSEPVTASIARISFTETQVRIYFPEPRTGFNDLVRTWGYRWDRPYWSRETPPEQQPDRAAELAHALLAAGYCVKGPRSVMETAVAQTFAPEPVRTISRAKGGEYDGWFSIWWHKERGGALKEPVKRLRGSRWQGGSVVVPPEQFEAVLDFAAMYDCHICPSARQVADEARAEQDAAIVVSVSAVAVELPVASNSRPPVLDVPDNVEVDNDLADND